MIGTAATLTGNVSNLATVLAHQIIVFHGAKSDELSPRRWLLSVANMAPMLGSLSYF